MPDTFDGASGYPRGRGSRPTLKAFPDAALNLATFLQEHSKDLGDPGPDNAFGAGRLSLGEPAGAAAPEETPVVTEAEPAATEETPAVTEAEPEETPAATETEAALVETEAAKSTEVAELLPTSTPPPR
jgi:hypothetical protein